MNIKQRLIDIGEFEIGDIVTVSEYCYKNKQGGTEIAKEKIKCRITKRWNDEECGWRYWATMVGDIGQLLSTKKIYIGQFDIIDVEV